MDMIVFLLFLTYQLSSTSCYELKQIVILSRHNVRTPLSKELARMTPKSWPRWQNGEGELTAKGALLEAYMGKYVAADLRKEGLLQDPCPSEDVFFAYANNKQRTKASAKAFIEGAFPDCKIAVHHQSGDETDPVFNPVIHNSTKEFEELAKKQMVERLAEISLPSSFAELQAILNFGESAECKENHHCDLVKDLTTIDNVVVGKEPELPGALHIGNAAVDTFKMEYYEGFPIEDVAWGEITKPAQWDNLMALNIGYHNVRFNTTTVSRDIATPLVVYIRDVFLNENEQPKVSLLMGHDANILTVLCSLGFKPYSLIHQHENTPVGGKIMFQKWWDGDNKRNLLKLQYVYQTSEQLRDAVELDNKNPPKVVTLELNSCPTIDESGFCLWNDFIDLLKSF